MLYQTPLLLVTLAIFHSSGGLLFGNKQKVTARGRLVCAGDPQKAAGITVKLVDYDFGKVCKHAESIGDMCCTYFTMSDLLPQNAGDRLSIARVPWGDGPDPDDTMARGKTDREGNFLLSGSATEFGRIEPRIQIYHDCNDGHKPCQRKWKINIPRKYINGQPFDTGILNLEMKLPSESRDCIH